jgi:uncharacterized iron-regulated membrane protein
MDPMIAACLAVIALIVVAVVMFRSRKPRQD